MARFLGAGKQYFDDNNDVLSGGLLYFYETGTTTDKATYSDAAETVQNPQPVVLDAAGRQPDIFFTGTARVVVETSEGAQIEVVDPAGEASSATAFQLWDSTVTYSQNDLTRGSNGKYYKSIVNNNTNNDPTTNAAAWGQVRFIGTYNVNISYDENDIVQSGNKKLWISLVGNNTNNTPQTSPTFWRPLSNELWTDTTVQAANFTAASGSRYLIDTSAGAFIMTLPLAPNAGDIVGFVDEGQSFDVNNLTVGRNGEKIMNLAEDMLADKKYFSGALQYTTDKGWVLV